MEMEEHSLMAGPNDVNPALAAMTGEGHGSPLRGETFRHIQDPRLRVNQRPLDTMDGKDDSEDDREYMDAQGSVGNGHYVRYTESERQAAPHSLVEGDLLSVSTRLPQDMEDGRAGGQTRRSKSLPEKLEDKVYKCTFTMDNIISLANDRGMDVAEHNSRYRA
eukprot:CAMPEP_0184696148 /NCGR_PEP_ID=MMETSP0313-20130426/3539_1 /TAXON_ID=2792 /ORGANISM="Porphyridium aerugineum, Strain SAG 1380-2" /LENGTH=162 /DNA_ID=CAMNT_0027154719 /DNA_START=180 /DNA_END=664 /DNA_ORIENTATION=-